MTPRATWIIPRRGKGRRKAEESADALLPSPKGVGIPPWLPETEGDLAKRQAHSNKMRLKLLAIPGVARLPAPKHSRLIDTVLAALDTWVTSKDALWHNPRVPIVGALGIAARATGGS